MWLFSSEGNAGKGDKLVVVTLSVFTRPRMTGTSGLDYILF